MLNTGECDVYVHADHMRYGFDAPSLYAAGIILLLYTSTSSILSSKQAPYFNQHI